jgi:hypothetical protein
MVFATINYPQFPQASASIGRPNNLISDGWLIRASQAEPIPLPVAVRSLNSFYKQSLSELAVKQRF